MSGMSRILTSRGAVSGVLLILLGAWGGLVPFVGPYFHYAYTPDTPWHFTLARLWLEVLPGAAAVAGGVLVTVSTRRLLTAGGMVLAALAGAWFAVGNAVNSLWPHLGTPGVPLGSAGRMGLEEIGFFTGLGIVIVFIAALALGRFLAAASPAGPVAAVATDSLPAEQ
jgi:Flp pilus assembly pilin Flp